MSDSKPKPAPEIDALPHSLTFFLTARERRDALRALKKRNTDRARALLGALRVKLDHREGDSHG